MARKLQRTTISGWELLLPKDGFLLWSWKMPLAKKANDNDPLGLEVEVAEREDAPGNWTVEAVDAGSDGEIYQAIFIGPRARERAYAYARTEYGFEGDDRST